MNNKLKKIIIPSVLLVTMGTASFALTDRILINNETFSFINKKDKISNQFDSSYDITGNIDNADIEKKQLITDLTKKTTYLLLGETNMTNESSENYFKRHRDYLELRYNPEIPKDPNTYTGYDEESQEYKDDMISGMSVPGIFLMINELDIIYNSYGSIRILEVDDEMVISTITIPDIKIKEKDTEDPMKYKYVKTDLSMVYYFKKLNNEYKLLYLYGETNDEIEEYIENSKEKRGELSKDSEYDSQLEDLYNFSKARAITDDTLNEIYDENKEKIVFLKSGYNTGIVTSANGFFIGNGIIATTYNFIEKSLMKAQNIIISDNFGTVYELDGIVTMNMDNDIAILKVQASNQAFIEIEEVGKLEREDAVISLNSKIGVGLSASKGIIIYDNNSIQTSLPITEEMQGSPIFNENGILIGMLNSKSINTSISYATNIRVLREYYNRLSNSNYDEIRAVSFEKMKENYYIKYNEEKVVNNIPDDKWNDYPELENIDKMIGMKLVKSSYRDGIISLRYKNNVSNYINTMQLASLYRQNLKDKGYEENNISNSKVIYKNNKYQIIIMAECDYLIIVMVRL